MPFKDPVKRKAYVRDQAKKRYRADPESYRLRNEERKKKLRAFIASLKVTGCSRCPEKDPACMDFHHRDGSTKEISIGQVVAAGWSIERIKREAEKCDVLCANCHRKEHAGVAQR